MKRYGLVLIGVLVLSFFVVSTVSAVVVFPLNWPSQNQPQETPPVFTPDWGGHLSPPIMDVPPVIPPETPRGPDKGGRIAYAYVLCVGVCYPEYGPGLSVTESVTKEGNFCYANYLDAHAASAELGEQAKQECREKLVSQCRGTLLGVLFFDAPVPKWCAHEQTEVTP